MLKQVQQDVVAIQIPKKPYTNGRHPELVSGPEWHEHLAGKMLKQVQQDVVAT